MTCPEGEAGVQLSLDHEERHGPAVARASVEHHADRAISGASPGCWRSIPSLLITLTPGYFWYLCLTPDGPGRVNVLFGGGHAARTGWPTPRRRPHLAAVKTLLDDVNVEDKGCTEKVYRGLCAGLSAPGPLSHLERPNFEFAQYLASRIPA